MRPALLSIIHNQQSRHPNDISNTLLRVTLHHRHWVFMFLWACPGLTGIGSRRAALFPDSTAVSNDKNKHCSQKQLCGSNLYRYSAKLKSRIISFLAPWDVSFSFYWAWKSKWKKKQNKTEVNSSSRKVHSHSNIAKPYGLGLFNWAFATSVVSICHIHVIL